MFIIWVETVTKVKKTKLWVILLFGFHHYFHLSSLLAYKPRSLLNYNIFFHSFWLKIKIISKLEIKGTVAYFYSKRNYDNCDSHNFEWHSTDSLKNKHKTEKNRPIQPVIHIVMERQRTDP